jgi:hypothetical protein
VRRLHCGLHSGTVSALSCHCRCHKCISHLERCVKSLTVCVQTINVVYLLRCFVLSGLFPSPRDTCYTSVHQLCCTSSSLFSPSIKVVLWRTSLCKKTVHYDGNPTTTSSSLATQAHRCVYGQKWTAVFISHTNK